MHTHTSHNSTFSTAHTANNSFRVWECALWLALCISLCFGVHDMARQRRLTDGIIRIHVIAASDARDEQQVKISVRDAVLAYLTPQLTACESTDAARLRITQLLPDLTACAEQAAAGRDVHVQFGRCSYGTREAETYTLPAGQYLSLRVVLGPGEGHNWWGVLYPQLTMQCLESADNDAVRAVHILGEDNVRLISEGEEQYVIRFQVLEWLEEARQRLEAIS